MRGPSPAPPRAWRALALAFPVLVLTAPFSAGIPGVAAVASRPTLEPTPPVSVPLTRPAPPASASRAASAAEAAQALQEHLAAVGLSGAVKMMAADGTVVAEGDVSAAERDRWLETQVWFDGRFHGAFALIDKVGAAIAAEAPPRLDVRAVSGGAVPYLITGSGDRYTEGAVLAGGWVVVHIGGDRIVLRRGDRQLEIGL